MVEKTKRFINACLENVNSVFKKLALEIFLTAKIYLCLL